MKYGIFIGRFQPVTISHYEIINTSLRIFDKVIILIGSSKSPISLRNPFPLEIREEMIKKISENSDKLIISSIADSNYNFSQWVKDVQISVEKIVYPNQTKFDDISIIGSWKDSGSYWLKSFPQWSLETVKLFPYWSGSQIRENYFNKSNEWEVNVSEQIKDFIIDWKINSKYFDNLCKEQEFIKNYKKQWDSVPFPPIFVTTDSLVICKGHILLIKRKRNPGKNLYALPGGFLNPNEFIKDCALRELKEETKINVDRIILENCLKKIKVFDNPFRDERGRTITHCHIFDLNMKIPEVKAEDDAKKVMWVPFNEIDNIQEKFYADHYQIIKNILNEM
jgi:bifunctional NMN adenylyltransferase/nudix hydrolase